MATTEANPRLDAALLYALLEWPVIPLHTPDAGGICDCPKHGECPKPGKHPRTMNGLKDATTDERKVRRYWAMWPNANIGVDLAAAGLVDIAPDSLEWFAEFIARGLPNTLTFNSGGGEGHRHHLYRRPAGCAIYRLTETEKFDLLSAGYAVMPPSLHQSGLTYEWLPPGFPLTPPALPAPAWAVQLLDTRGGRPQGTTDVADDPEAPPVHLIGEALQRWSGRLYETKPGGGLDRSFSLWRIAVDLLEAGLQPRFVEQQLAERDIALGWEKFAGRRDASVRYRVIVARAKASQGPKRIRLNARSSQRSSGVLHYQTARELAEMQDPDIAWRVLGLVGGGLITELDGAIKRSGKTTLVLALIRAILYGELFLGLATSYCPVVYLAEQSGPSFKRALKRAGLLDREDLHILLWGQTTGLTWDQVIKDALRYTERVAAGLLVVDTLGQFSGVKGDNENSSGAAMDVMKPLQTATLDSVLAVLVNRHDRKGGGEVGDSGRGSSAYGGSVDIILHLQRQTEVQPGEQRQRLLESLSRFEETPDQLVIELSESEPFQYTSLGEIDQLRDETLRVEILSRLPTEPEDAVKHTELQNAIGGRALDFSRVLKVLVSDGTVVRLGKGIKGSPYAYYQRVFADDDD